MSEIKRLNRLWSNESFYLKEFIDIPIYEETEVRNTSASVTKPSETVKKKLETNPETVQDIFKRIDLNIRKTTSTIRSSPWNSRYDPRIPNVVQTSRDPHFDFYCFFEIFGSAAINSTICFCIRNYFRIDPYDSAPQLRHGSWHSLKLTSGYQNEAYQDI